MKKQTTADPVLCTDMHCHLLPQMDDGPKDISESNNALCLAVNRGVVRLVFTPHYYPEQETIGEFLSRRAAAFDNVSGLCHELGLQTVLGAEVKMHSEADYKGMNALVIGSSPFLLLEWPTHQHPLWGKNYVCAVLNQGIIPVFAHIERYGYFMNNLALLEEWRDAGVLFQMNAESFINKQTRRAALQLVKNGFCDLVASDSHNAEKRPPCLPEALSVIERKLGREYAEDLTACADRIFSGDSAEQL